MAEIAIMKQNFNAINSILDRQNVKNNEYISQTLFGGTEKELSKRFDENKDGNIDEKEAKNLKIFKASIIQSKFDINRSYKLDEEELATFDNYITNLKIKQLKEKLTQENSKDINALLSGINELANKSDWQTAQESIKRLNLSDDTKKQLLQKLINRIQTNKTFEKNLEILKTSQDDSIKYNILSQMTDSEFLAINNSDMSKILKESVAYFAISEDDKTIAELIKRMNKIGQDPLTKSGLYFDTTGERLSHSTKPTDLSSQRGYEVYKAWYKIKKEKSEEYALEQISTIWKNIQDKLK